MVALSIENGSNHSRAQLASCALSPCSYISKVDVLHLLVAAAYRHVPSLDQILQPAAVTRLRNQLLEAEYYQLGVEVRQG